MFRVFSDLGGNECYIAITVKEVDSISYSTGGTKRTIITKKNKDTYTVKESPAEVLEILYSSSVKGGRE